MTVKAIYPGSFDPITNGHLDIITRAVGVFGGLTVMVARNSKKHGLFSVEERMDLIAEATGHSLKIEVVSHEGLLVDYAAEVDANVLIRGLRAVADFEFEGQMAGMNRHLNPKLETFFMMTSADNFFVSSSMVREVASLGGDISAYVPPAVNAALAARFHK